MQTCVRVNRPVNDPGNLIFTEDHLLHGFDCMLVDVFDVFQLGGMSIGKGIGGHGNFPPLSIEAGVRPLKRVATARHEPVDLETERLIRQPLVNVDGELGPCSWHVHDLSAIPSVGVAKTAGPEQGDLLQLVPMTADMVDDLLRFPRDLLTRQARPLWVSRVDIALCTGIQHGPLHGKRGTGRG